ncbi:hypothetical protein HHI36_002468 [Cryptolaemus montrouzieri]|uniref:CHK kinase-like domain-containing protein n=1 Tax=Cryptolaemus montrouzieri TaxID=559131 RepID=A0ABD2PAL5_9CUCU
MCELQEKQKSWVEEVLKEKNFNKIEIEFPDFDPNGGQSSLMSFVKVLAEKNGEKSIFDLIIKRGRDDGCDPLNLKLIYVNEVYFYSQIVPCFEKFAKGKNVVPFENIPHCYGTITQEEQYVIVLENLKPKGFRLHNLHEPMDIDHVRLVVEAYAKWHAFSFALRDQQPWCFDELAQCSQEIRNCKIKDFVIPTTQREIDAVIEIYEKKKDSVMAEKLRALKVNCFQSLKDYYSANDDEDYLVIRHGDCWMNNFIFQYKENQTTPEKVAVIDWQLSMMGSPMLDLTHFLFYACSRKELDQLDDIINFYYDNLSKNILNLGSDPMKCYPKERLIQSFKHYAPSAIAGVPVMVKVCFTPDIPKKYDMSKVSEEGSFNCLLEGGMIDVEGYFKRIDDVLKLCVKRGFL